MEEKSKFGISSLLYGLILGVVLVVYALILQTLDLTANKALGYINYVLMIVGLIIFTKMYRDKNLNGYISYGKAFGFSMVVLLIAVLISSIFGYVMMTLNPEILEKMMAAGAEEAYNKGLSDEQIELSQKMMSPGLIYGMGFIVMMFLGTLIALITSAIVKKNEDPYQNAMEDINEE